MRYRLMQAKVLKMNHLLPFFPNATEQSRFSPREILEILEFSLPDAWTAQFDLKGYVPTQHSKERLLIEAEAIERNEKEKEKKKRKREEPTTQSRSARRKASREKREKEVNLNKKFCSEHGWGNHTSKECWTLHPSLMPEKFRATDGTKAKATKATTKPPSKKELNAMVQKELYALLKGEKTTKTKKTKKARKNESDSDESLNQLSETENTPEPSEDESNMVARVKAFAKKAQQKNEGSSSEDE